MRMRRRRLLVPLCLAAALHTGEAAAAHRGTMHAASRRLLQPITSDLIASDGVVNSAGVASAQPAMSAYNQQLASLQTPVSVTPAVAGTMYPAAASSVHPTRAHVLKSSESLYCVTLLLLVPYILRVHSDEKRPRQDSGPTPVSGGSFSWANGQTGTTRPHLDPTWTP